MTTDTEGHGFNTTETDFWTRTTGYTATVTLQLASNGQTFTGRASADIDPADPGEGYARLARAAAIHLPPDLTAALEAEIRQGFGGPNSAAQKG